jgi:hypothetical protein
MSGEKIDLMVDGLSLCRFKHLHKILQKCDSGVYQHFILAISTPAILRIKHLHQYHHQNDMFAEWVE